MHLQLLSHVADVALCEQLITSDDQIGLAHHCHIGLAR